MPADLFDFYDFADYSITLILCLLQTY